MQHTVVAYCTLKVFHFVLVSSKLHFEQWYAALPLCVSHAFALQIALLAHPHTLHYAIKLADILPSLVRIATHKRLYNCVSQQINILDTCKRNSSSLQFARVVLFAFIVCCRMQHYRVAFCTLAYPCTYHYCNYVVVSVHFAPNISCFVAYCNFNKY